jgi:hypothetical protein
VLSQVVNTSSAERCWSTYSFIHSVKRNRLNVNRSESLVYVHYNLRLLSHYCEEAKMDKNLKRWDNNPEEDNLEDGVLLLEQLENALLDDDDHVEMPPPSTSMVPMSRTPGTTLGASSSLPRRDRLHLLLHSFVLLRRLHYHHEEAHATIVVVEGGWDSCLMFLLFHCFICHSL